MLLAQVADATPGWLQGGAVGVVCTIAILLLAKTIPKLRDDERADKVAIALAASTAMALIVAQHEEQVARHAKSFHDERERWQAQASVYELRITKLTDALIERTNKGIHAAAE